jgi:hypothetical protein
MDSLHSPSDLEEWALMQKIDVQIQHIEKYMNGKGEVLYDFPDLELTQENESLKTTDKNNALYEIVKAGLLNVIPRQWPRPLLLEELEMVSHSGKIKIGRC